MKTIRLMTADWQAGAKTEYFLGQRLLEMIAPENKAQKNVRVQVAEPSANHIFAEEDGVEERSACHSNVKNAKAAIEKEEPDRIITLGGNCLVSQAPFDYLHGRYEKELGIIWFDAHPDISNPAMFNHEHAMVLANLLGQGDPLLAKETEHRF